MPGSLLKDDLQKSIEDQLQNYARGIQSNFQQIGDTAADLAQAGRQSFQDIQNQLSEYATQQFNQANQAALEEQQRKAAQQAQVQQQLQDYATGLSNQAQPAVQQPSAAGSPQMVQQPGGGLAAPPTSGDISQFGDRQLTNAEAYAACGPAAAVRFAQRFGRNPTLREAVDIARTVGFDEQGGMNGLANQKRLMDAMDVPTRVVGPDWQAFAREASTGNPVTISTPGHYYYADSYNPQTGQFHVGRSGTDLRGGSEWMTREQMESRMGAADGALFADNPSVSAPSTTRPGAPMSSQNLTQTTASMSGGGNADGGNLTDRARTLLQAGADAAARFGGDAAKAVQAVLVTEGGLNNARGDSGSSAGPLQFFGEEGGRGGQLNQLANFLGTSLEGARQWAEQHAAEAIQWAIGTPEKPGYLGAAIISGLQQGRSGADLATFIQRTGQVSVSPERAGQNYDALFSGGQELVQGARQGLEDLNRPLAVQFAGEQEAAKAPLIGRQRETGEAPLPLVDQINALQGQLDNLRRQLEPMNAPPLAEGAPVRQALETTARQVGPNLGFDDAELERRRQAVRETPPLVQPPEWRPKQPQEYGVADVVGGVLGVAGQALNPLGDTPFRQVQSDEQRRLAAERVAREDIGSRLPTRDIGPIVQLPGQPEPTPLIGGLVQGIVDMYVQNPFVFGPGPIASEVNAWGSGIVRSIAPQLGPLASRFTAAAINGGIQNAMFEAGQKDATPQSIGEQFLIGAGFGTVLHGLTAEAPAAVVSIGREFLRRLPELEPILRARQPAQAEVGFAMGRPAPREPEPSRAPVEPEVPTRRMFHGTAGAFDRPDAGRFDPNGLYGPGYYLTSEPRVAGGIVAGETIRPATNVQEAIRQFEATGIPGGGVERGAVLREGYAQGRMPAFYADMQEALEDAAYYRNLAAGQDPHYPNPTPEQIDKWSFSARESQRRADGLARNLPDVGPNVRAVDVPETLRLFDTEQRMQPTELERILDQMDPRDVSSVENRLRGVREPTNETLYRALIDVEKWPERVNSYLRDLGYEGVQYPGGQRVPMSDEAGRPLEHTAINVFPESIDKLRNAISRRQGGQATPPFAINLGGGVLGGYAGAQATPQDASPEEKLRNIGLGALAGLGSTHLITSRGRPLRLAEATPRRAPEGFRAPERPETGLLRATTQEPPGGPGEGIPLRQADTTPRARRLEDVHTNPYALREPGPTERAMSPDDIQSYAAELEQRSEEIQNRRDAVDELIRNPKQPIERPPWAAGYTNYQIAEIARRNGISPYEEAWWDRVGLSSGSGEVREDVGQSGLRGAPGQRDLTPAQLRAELRRLDQEAGDITAAYEQMGNAPAGARLTRQARPERGALPFDVGTGEVPTGPGAVEGSGSSGVVAADIVTRNGRQARPSGLHTLWSDSSQVGTEGGQVTGRGIVDAEGAGVGRPSRATEKAMPNLNALLKDQPPEIVAQIQKAVEDNADLFAAYNQGRISHGSLTDDLARKVGMDTKAWLATPIGKGFSTPELVALQASAVDAMHGAQDLARDILNRGGVDDLTAQEVAFSLRNLFDASGVLAVARGARSTQGRNLNSLKIRFDRTLARDITGTNEKKAAAAAARQARSARTKAKTLLDKGRDLETEAAAARTNAREQGAPRNILNQIDDAYAQLDHYNAMSLHEKADEFNRLRDERAKRAAARKEKVRSAPEELLSALKAELAAEQKIFAGRKDTWETMAFWDSKAGEIAAEKRQGFRGQLYLEQQRRAADIAARNEATRADRAWERASKEDTARTNRAKTLLENIGGEAPSRDLLKAFTEAMTSPDNMAAAKFLRGLHPKRSGFANVVEVLRNANIMRLAGMLSGTATHMVNVFGSAINVPLALAEHAGAAAIDIPRAAVTGGERRAYFSDLGPMVRGWVRPDGESLGALTFLPQVLETLKSGVSPADVADLSKLRPGFRSYVPGQAGEIVDAAIEMPLRLLEAEDQVMFGRAFGMHAQRVAMGEATKEGFRGAQRTGRANDIIKNLEEYPELFKDVYDAAKRMVMQERRTVPGMSNVHVGGTPGELAQVAVSQPMPFRKTPVNIVAQGMGLSPFGVLGVAEAVGSRSAIAVKVRTGELPRERLGRQTLLAEQRAARAAIGASILGVGYWFGTQRDENGKPKHTLTAMYDEDEASTYPLGWREWSMRTENPADGSIVYTPLNNFGVAGVPLAMAAIAADADRRGKTIVSDEKELARATAAIGRYALDTPFLQGMSDVVNLLHDPARAGNKFIEGLISSYGPYSAMGRQVQRAFGVASRNPREGWNMLLDALEADYPGLSGNVPEATTALGEPRTPGQTGIAAFASPLRYDVERDNPTLQALREAGVRVPDAPKTISVGRGYGIELTEAEQDQVKRARGAQITLSVERAMQNPRMVELQRAVRTAPQGSPEQQQALARYNAALQAAVSGAAQAANNQFIRQLGREQMAARMKPTREVEPFYLGPPGTQASEQLGEVVGG